MRFRSLTAALGALLLPLLLAAPALGRADGGEGLYGKTDDKVITNFGFGLMIGFVLLITVLSVLQSQLEKRKHK